VTAEGAVEAAAAAVPPAAVAAAVAARVGEEIMTFAMHIAPSARLGHARIDVKPIS
jgi:hypothetical protein